MGWIEALKGTRSQQLYRWLVGEQKLPSFDECPLCDESSRRWKELFFDFDKVPFIKEGWQYNLCGYCLLRGKCHPAFPAERLIRRLNELLALIQ